MRPRSCHQGVTISIIRIVELPFQADWVFRPHLLHSTGASLNYYCVVVALNCAAIASIMCYATCRELMYIHSSTVFRVTVQMFVGGRWWFFRTCTQRDTIKSVIICAAYINLPYLKGIPSADGDKVGLRAGLFFEDEADPNRFLLELAGLYITKHFYQLKKLYH